MHLNGDPIHHAVIRIPSTGVWWADVYTSGDKDVAAGDACVLDLDTLIMNGTAATAASVSDQPRMRIVGGGDGLSKDVPPRFLMGVTVEFALRELLGLVGESLSTDSDPVALARVLRRWTRMQGKAIEDLNEIVRHVEKSWRVLPDGKVWLGEESFDEYEEVNEHVLLDEFPEEQRRIYGVETPELLPGVAFKGWDIGTVVHRLNSDGSGTTEVYGV